MDVLCIRWGLVYRQMGVFTEFVVMAMELVASEQQAIRSTCL